MDKKKDLRWIKYVVSISVGLIVSFLIAIWRGLFSSVDANDVFSALVDGTFVVGILLTGVGLLILVMNTGTLDIIGFGFRSVLYLFTPFGNFRERQDYYDYKQKKQELADDAALLWGAGALPIPFSMGEDHLDALRQT